MRVGIVTSREDAASLTIREQLLARYPFEPVDREIGEAPAHAWTPPGGDPVELGLIDAPLISATGLDAAFATDVLIFASRHTSKSGTPALLAHATGNWTTQAEYGGAPRRVSRASGYLLKRTREALARQREALDLRHDVSLEVTHHGPTEMTTPLLFVELGSKAADWREARPGQAVATAIAEVAETASRWRVPLTPGVKWNPPENVLVGIGFGGTHYAPLFNKLAERTRYTTAHIVPKYHVRKLAPDLIQHIVERVVEPVSAFLLDWKGMNAADKHHLLPLLEECAPEVPVKRVRKLIKATAGARTEVTR